MSKKVKSKKYMYDDMMMLPEYGFGSWLKENAGGLLKGAGSLVTLIPGVGQIAGPVIGLAGAAVGRAQQNKQDKAMVAAQQAEINAKMQADTKAAYMSNRSIREGNLFGDETMNYGSTFAYGGLLMGEPNKRLVSNDPRYIKPTPHRSNPNWTPLTEEQAKMYPAEDIIALQGKRRSTVNKGKIQYFLRNSIPQEELPVPSPAPADSAVQASYYDFSTMMPVGKGEKYMFNGKALGGDLMMNSGGNSNPRLIDYTGKADKHSEGIGGVPVDMKGNPTMTSRMSAVGMVEGGELIYNGFVFSNSDKMKLKKHGNSYTS